METRAARKGIFARQWMQRVAREPPLGLLGLFNDGSVEADEPGRSKGEELMAPRDDAQPTVIVIDDDRDVREALDNLVRSIGLRAKLFASVHEFLSAGHTDQPGCLVLDVRLPGRSGLDFHDDLVKANVHLPVIFISGFADVPMSVRALKAGAVEFLTKPFRQQDLLEAIQLAVERDRTRREHESAIAGLRASYDTLSPRESEVMLVVAAGRLYKHA